MVESPGNMPHMVPAGNPFKEPVGRVSEMPQDTVRTELEALRRIGMDLSNAGPLHVRYAFFKIRPRLRLLTPDILCMLPMCRDETLAAGNTLMLKVATHVRCIHPNLFACLTLRAADETLKYGLHRHSAATFMNLSAVVQSEAGDYEQAWRIAKSAIALERKLGDGKSAGQAYHDFACYIQHWKKHAAHDVEIYAKARQLSLEAGDVIFAALCLNDVADCRLMIGDRLDSVLQELEAHRPFIREIRDPLIAARYAENIRFIQCLNGDGSLTPAGKDFDPEAHLEILRKGRNDYGLCVVLLCKARLFYLHGQYEEGLQALAATEKHIQAASGTLIAPEYHFYSGLILAALLAGRNVGPIRKLKYKAAIRKHLSHLSGWAELCPENFRHKHDLILAESMAEDGRFKEAVQLYHAAIRGALRNGYIHEKAMACERLAMFYHRLDARDEARVLMQRAHRCYGQWGATAKQDELEELYPELMSDVLKSDAGGCGAPQGASKPPEPGSAGKAPQPEILPITPKQQSAQAKA
jgi:histidine kinase